MSSVALTIAGSDPSGGAGIQADLKTFHHFGVYGESVVTLLTVQNTREVRDVCVLDPAFVREQLRAVVDDIPPAAAKTGALGSSTMIEMIADEAARFAFPLVVDPVMISKHGAPLMDEAGRAAMRESLLPAAALVTPNLHEAAVLLGRPVESIDAMAEAMREIAGLGPRAVLIKGGALAGEAVDLLYANGRAHRLAAPRIETKHLHGTGCAYSAAITAQLAQGSDMVEAVLAAKRWITAAVRTAPGLGGGFGPVNVHADLAGDAITVNLL